MYPDLHTNQGSLNLLNHQEVMHTVGKLTELSLAAKRINLPLFRPHSVLVSEAIDV